MPAIRAEVEGSVVEFHLEGGRVRFTAPMAAWLRDTYMPVWWVKGKLYGADGETEFERTWWEKRGREYDAYSDATEVTAAPSAPDDGAVRAWTLYLLTDPRTGAVRYAGISADPAQRLAAHLTPAEPGEHVSNPGMRAWIAALADVKLEPVMVCLPGTITGTRAEAEQAEEALVLDCAAKGMPLLNRQYLEPGLHPRDFAARARVLTSC